MAEKQSKLGGKNCFVCSPHNPIGLGVKFEYDNGVCRGEFEPNEHHVGFDGIAHGGIIFSVLDDVMANWIFLQQGRGFTAKCEIRYRDPLPVGTKILLECRFKRRKGRLVQLSSSAVRADGTLVAEADASFMLEELGNIAATF
jgi:acyl-coenzyme A thioesterase PaaI-like protein